MSAMQLLFLAMIFVLVTGSVSIALLKFGPNRTEQRLKHLEKSAPVKLLDEEPAWQQKVVKVVGPMAKLALPEEGWENSPLRSKFMNAGYRGAAVANFYFATKSMLLFLLPVIFLLFAPAKLKTLTLVEVVIVLAAIGFYLPNFVLSQKVKSRQLEIFESFPDAVDLMTVCVEAGLSLDSALARVAEEIKLKSLVLASEMHLVILDLRAGNTRERALRNLAMRTGVEELNSFVAMLIQADRFGTSIAESLRVYSDDLRTKRRLRAEEAAAKVATKLLFPLLFCIFPSLLLVVLGPAMISVYRNLLPLMSGH